MFVIFLINLVRIMHLLIFFILFLSFNIFVLFLDYVKKNMACPWSHEACTTSSRPSASHSAQL